jgi:hypothetical protein
MASTKEALITRASERLCSNHNGRVEYRILYQLDRHLFITIYAMHKIKICQREYLLNAVYVFNDALEPTLQTRDLVHVSKPRMAK